MDGGLAVLQADARLGEVELDSKPERLSLRDQQRLLLLMRGEQGAAAGAQCRVAFASGVEPRSAFLRRLGQRRLKRGFFG